MTPTDQQSSRSDLLLAQLLEELHGRQRRGEAADVDALARAHPEVAAELRQLWAAVQFAEAFAPPPGAATRAGPVTLPYQPAAPPILPRTFGDYELLAELGRGGMGVVFKARQVSLDRVVALKMILHAEAAGAEELARFQAEAQAAARLDKHAHIVPIYEAGVCDNQAYFSMKYVDGTTLAARLADHPLPPRDAARLLATVARAVHYGHEHGILHRDLKPSNILLDADGQPYITDFGLAKRVARTPGESLPPSLTQTNAIVGTPSYMSPEQAFGQPLTAASDVYSLGAVLYEMLTGRPPFRAATLADTLLLVREQEPVPPRALNPNVDPDLELICLQCLQKSPRQRYATAAALADDLDAFLRGEPPSVRSASLRHFVGRMLRDTPNAPVLENWGLLWMWHSLKIFLLCLVTNVMLWAGVTNFWLYFLLWSVGLVVWGTIFWQLRKRGGPVLFVERQIAHVWASAVLATISLFVVERLLGLPPLTLTPVLAVVASMVFVVKAGMLSGAFYFAAALLLLAVVPMALFPEVGPLLFGVASAACFLLPGWKYYRQRNQAGQFGS